MNTLTERQWLADQQQADSIKADSPQYRPRHVISQVATFLLAPTC